MENSDESIYVPICKGDYSEKLFYIKEINDIENYMWLFTKDWPNVYEVENEIYIIGNVKEKGKFNSKYRIKIANKNEAESFFTLLKALFIITTESNYRYSFEPIVNEEGEIVFLFDGKEIKTAEMVKTLANLKVEGKAVVLLPANDVNVQKSARNIEGVKTLTVDTINVYDLLKYNKLVVTEDTVKKLEEVYA